MEVLEASKLEACLGNASSKTGRHEGGLCAFFQIVNQQMWATRL
jgi:hypothetical protein